jgi:hypothetical protein
VQFIVLSAPMKSSEIPWRTLMAQFGYPVVQSRRGVQKEDKLTLMDEIGTIKKARHCWRAF